MIALIFAEYLNRIFWHVTQFPDTAPDAVPDWAIKLTAVISIIVITGICAATRNLGARAAVVFTSVKVSDCDVCCATFLISYSDNGIGLSLLSSQKIAGAEV